MTIEKEKIANLINYISNEQGKEAFHTFRSLMADKALSVFDRKSFEVARSFGERLAATAEAQHSKTNASN